MNTNPLPPFEFAFGRHAARLQGVEGWEQISGLGRANGERLVQLVQERVYALLTESAPRQELSALRECIDFLTRMLNEEPAVKPLLPRLRAENFRKGDSILLYAADSPGNVAPRPWVPAIISKVDKSYRAEWADGATNSGYYWRLTAAADFPLFPDALPVAFSTSEPRVLPRADFAYLIGAQNSDPEFVEVFSRNASRSWHPLWCQERGISSAGAAMDMKAWLHHAT